MEKNAGSEFEGLNPTTRQARKHRVAYTLLTDVPSLTGLHAGPHTRTASCTDQSAHLMQEQMLQLQPLRLVSTVIFDRLPHFYKMASGANHAAPSNELRGFAHNITYLHWDIVSRYAGGHGHHCSR
jgi:hypothetical protein